jgi:hypothetical protein
MSRKTFLSKAERKRLLTLVVGLLVVLLAVIFVMPLFPVAETVLGVDPTLWQRAHAWFVTAREFVLTYAMYILLIVLGLTIYFRIKK